MALMSGRLQGRVAPFTAAARPARIISVRASASDPSADRRAVLLAGGLAFAAPLLLAPQPASAEQRFLPVDQLGSFQRSDQRSEFRTRAEKTIKENLTSKDAACLRKLVFNDAATYDRATQTGGMDGSIVLSSEIDRPESAGLKVLLAKLKDVKAKIDAQAAPGQQEISWADLIVLCAKASTQLEWSETKVSRAKTADGGQVIASTAFSAPWVVRVGRKDRADAAPGGRVPAADASVEEIRAFMLKLGADPNYSPGIFTPKPPFWDRPAFLMWTGCALDPEAEAARWAAAAPEFADLKNKYDLSKRTLTRTDFEVDFIDTYEKLTNLGAVYDADAYLFPIPMAAVKL